MDNIMDMAIYFFNTKKDYIKAEKFLRAAAEFGNHAEAQNSLGILYNLGSDAVQKNDLASLYWFDRAAEQGLEVAIKDRDGSMAAYYDNLGKGDFIEQLTLLSKWCMNGHPKVPKSAQMAYYWLRKMKEYLYAREKGGI